MDELKIKWVEMPTYNTVMAVAAGCGLLLVVALGRRLVKEQPTTADGWALAFGVLGFILTATGLHMTLTWPLAGQGFPFDNIIFGEPSLAFGVMLLATSFYLWRRGDVLADADPLGTAARVAGPLSLFVFAMGLACFGIAAAGVRYQLFAAPPQEPLTGVFAGVPWVEATFISLLYALVGVGAVLFPFALRARRGVVLSITGLAWTVAGAIFLLFGALNYFTHIGLIVNTM
ncbi:DUF981 domain-containing protein [Pseudonocardia spinosispora]|uniref:DUF981 domain-containing protein n=1 Tax=Pseudonocardia spinosispora TaxID=103441 RepID=UPI000408F370|nr:DUF981 domain-containing protein [Pseudonocardia spinosispora]